MTDVGDLDLDFLSDIIMDKRHRERLSLRVAAKQINTTTSSLCRIESGKVISIATLLKLLDWLGVSLDAVRSGYTGQATSMRLPDQISVLLRVNDLPDDDLIFLDRMFRMCYAVCEEKNRR